MSAERIKVIADRVDRALAARKDDDPFYVIDIGFVAEQYKKFKEALPMVRPYYAVKCNPNMAFLKLLKRLGCGFDCASSDEMDRVTKIGTKPDSAIFANPCKMASQIAHAKELGISRMTFDNVDELEKVAKVYPDAEMVLRIATNDSASLCAFSSKFGAHSEDIEDIFAAAKRLNVKIIGVSYHVGSGCPDPDAHAAAATDALKVFETGLKYGQKMHLLDIGGGFLGEEVPDISVADISKHLSPVLAKFPEGTEFIAEPGRFFACHSHTLVTQIHSRRVIRDKATGKVEKVLLYLNEGIYHSFNCIFFDHQHPIPHCVFADKEKGKGREVVKTTIFGPTCDSIDCICKDHDVPLMEVGEWFYFVDMGAYTVCAMTHFNGFDGAVRYVYTDGDKILDGNIDDHIEEVAAAHKM